VLVGLALGPYRLAWYLRVDGRLVPLPIALVGEA
jgi:hypothetical protein